MKENKSNREPEWCLIRVGTRGNNIDVDPLKVSNYLHQSARSIKFDVWLPVGAALVDNCLLVAFSLIPVSLFLLLIICLGSLSNHYSIDFCHTDSPLDITNDMAMHGHSIAWCVLMMVAEIVFFSFKLSHYLHQSAKSINHEVLLPSSGALVDNCILIAFSLIPLSLFLLITICLVSLSDYYSVDFCRCPHL